MMSLQGDSIRRLVELVLELGSEDEKRSRKNAGRSFAKTEILLHAMSVFNQQGLEDTSVQDLLNAANISRRTFFKYFSGKVEVLENIYVLASRVMIARFE
jgi:AcrR family transcriptional regulator